MPHPYPHQYVEPVALRDGTAATIRPIRPEDEPLVAAFHETLSEESVYFRYVSRFKLQARTAHERLAPRCNVDYRTEIALVAEVQTPEGPAILGIGRLITLSGGERAEFALVVSDRAHGLGIGTALLARLVRVGRDWGLRRIVGEILRTNGPMQHVARRVGFTLRWSEDFADPFVYADLELGGGAQAGR